MPEPFETPQIPHVFITEGTTDWSDRLYKIFKPEANYLLAMDVISGGKKTEYIASQQTILRELPYRIRFMVPKMGRTWHLVDYLLEMNSWGRKKIVMACGKLSSGIVRFSCNDYPSPFRYPRNIGDGFGVAMCPDCEKAYHLAKFREGRVPDRFPRAVRDLRNEQ